MGCCGCKEEDCCSDATTVVGDCGGYSPQIYRVACESLEETCRYRDEYNQTCSKYPGWDWPALIVTVTNHNN